jgi:hypothetical protein
MKCAILSSVACPALQYFSTLCHKRHDFRKILLNIKCVISFFYKLNKTLELNSFLENQRPLKANNISSETFFIEEELSEI